MIDVQISTAFGLKSIFTADVPLKVDALCKRIKELTNLSEENFYIVHNGKLMHESVICYNGYVSVLPRLFGGKGGFGSMLRAIGAQIEKTTNREACRDLSGRRLRDINEEKRLKVWIEKQGKRDEEAAERKKKKLERLCAEPRHEFADQTYERERSALTERVGDAVEEGFKTAGISSLKRKHEKEVKPNKKKLLLDMNIDSDELDSSDDSGEDDIKSKKVDKEEQISNDSGHSSDESGKINKTVSETVTKCSETPKDNENCTKDLEDKEEERKIVLSNQSEVLATNTLKSIEKCIEQSE